MPVVWLTTTTPAHGLTEPTEMHGTAQEVWANDKLTASVQLRCLWAERYGVLENILAFGRQWPYHNPASTIQVRAVSGSIGPDGAVATADGSGNVYAEAILNINFESAAATEPNEDGNVVIYSESIEPTLEFLTIPSKKFRWGVAAATEATRVIEGPGRMDAGLDYVLTYYNLTSIPSAFLTLVGTINSAAVPSSFFGASFPIGTLLYFPPKISRSVSFGSGADNKYTLTTRLTFKPNGWNKFWRPDSGGSAGGYEPMYYEGQTAPHEVYESTSFAGILPNGILP